METGAYQEVLKMAKINLIYKGNETNKISNYRPMLILSSFNKIFYIILLKRLFKFLNKYPILTPFQFGFLSVHSTTKAINLWYESIL